MIDTYRGRFAPSPSGPLHFGSLITATGSWCAARSRKGEWLIRIDDLDKPRIKTGAIDEILMTLESFGLLWDKKVMYQSNQIDFYVQYLEILKKKKETYICTCSRKDIVRNSRSRGVDGPIYPETCKQKFLKNIQGSIRISVKNKLVEFTDTFQGKIKSNIMIDVGDFILKRADNVFSYHLASIVDDHVMGITHVSRGADLLHSPPRQIYLMNRLNLEIPIYSHLPLAIDKEGRKLSKQDRDDPIIKMNPGIAVWKTLKFLNQSPPVDLKTYQPKEILNWAVQNWKEHLVPGLKTIQI